MGVDTEIIRGADYENGIYFEIQMIMIVITMMMIVIIMTMIVMMMILITMIMIVITMMIVIIIMMIIISAERHPLLDIGLPKMGGFAIIATLGRRVGDRSECGSYTRHRERCCPFSGKSLSRLLRHPREDMGWCYSLRPTPYGQQSQTPTVTN